jgi:hypothetical protein
MLGCAYARCVYGIIGRATIVAAAGRATADLRSFRRLRHQWLGGIALLAWTADYGRTHIGAISGYARPATIVVQSIGPIMMAQCFDQTGSYDLALWLTTVSWACAR